MTKRDSRGCAATDRRRLLRTAAALLAAPVAAVRAATPDVFTHVPEPAVPPDFALEDADRKVWRLSELRGRVVVVNFWATWCPPCRKELPSLAALHRATADKGVVVLGVNAGETWDTVAAFVAGATPPLGFPMLFDEKGIVMRAWKVKALPVTYVIDRRGRLVLRALGARDFSRPDAIADLERLARESSA